MESINTVLDQIPIRHNFPSHVMLLGIVQGYFLVLVIFSKSAWGTAVNLLGWALLVQCIVFTDTYLCYTGLMKYSLHLNDSTEILVLLIPPTIYFFIYALLLRETFTFKKLWPHLLLPVAYGISQIGYYMAPLPVKLNAYLGAYHSHLGFVPIPDKFNYYYLIIKDEFRWLILLSFTFYLALSLQLVIKSAKKNKLLPKKTKVNRYSFSRTAVALASFLLLFLLLVYLNFEDDGGDHYIGMVQTLIVFTTSFFFISESRFFEKSWLADKYETLTLNSIHFESVEDYVNQGELYLTSNLSLKDLAKSLGTNPNLVSKLINSKTGLNFNDYINKKRVGRAKKHLMDTSMSHLTVEGIGSSVGFTSKSAFYSAFKKHTGMTPSAYMKQKA